MVLLSVSVLGYEIQKQMFFDALRSWEGGGYSHTWPDGMCRSIGCPFAAKIMRQGIIIGKKIMRQGIV